MKAIILARVSSKDQEDNYSTPAQVLALTQYCQIQRFEIDEIIELVESSTKERKKFEALITKIKKYKEPVAIVCDCVDRLQRSFKESLLLDQMRKEGKVELHFKREALIINQNSNSSEIIRWDMGVMFARAYVLQLSDNVKRGNNQKINSGEWAGKAPVGYLNIRDSNDRPFVVPDPDRAPIIKMIFENYASGSDSMLTLLKKVSQMGIFGTSNPSVSRIEHILKNPFYYGEMRVKGELYPHKYTPIIEKDLFMRASERRVINFTGGKHTNKNYIFKGVFKCGKCGHQICGDGPKKNNIYYRCSNQWCETYNKSTNEKELLEIWMEILKTLIVPDDVIKITVDTLKTAVQAKTDYKLSRLRTLRIEWDKIENRIQKVYMDKLDGLISEDQYKKYTTQFKGRQNEIKQEESNFDLADDNFYLEAEKALNYASNLYNVFLLADVDEQNAIIKGITSNSVLTPDLIDIYLIKPYSTIQENYSLPTWHMLQEDFRTLPWHEIKLQFAF